MLVFAAVIAGAGYWALERVQRAKSAARQSLEFRMAGIVSSRGKTEIACETVVAGKPVVLLALGQSNAANHGTRDGPSPEVTLIDDERCVIAGDPLPGGTGDGGSIWSRLPGQMRAAGLKRPVVLSVLAVDATTIADWTAADSPLVARLKRRIDTLRALGAQPTLILWQQGEADAKRGTSEMDYLASLQALDRNLTAFGVGAPVLLARSTSCRSRPDERIRRALDQAIALNSRFGQGPDTDALPEQTMRRDSCHLNADGLGAAAALWAPIVLSRSLGA